MENSAPFDLNDAIEQWRANLLQSAAFRPENVEELESHLRDSVAKLEQQGLSQEEAFVIGVRRLGKAGSLEGEFAKINTRAVWLDRIFWILIGFQVLSFTSSALHVVSSAAFDVAAVNYPIKPTSLALPVALYSALDLVMIAASLALSWWLIVRKGPSMAARFGALLNPALIAAGVGLCLISVAPTALSYFRYLVLARFCSTEIISSAVTCQSYSQYITLPLRAAIFVAITLMVFRKRLQLKRTAQQSDNPGCQTIL